MTFQSTARWTTSGVNPAAPHAATMCVRQGLCGIGAIQTSWAASARSASSRPASGWSAGTTRSNGSSRSGRCSKRASADGGLTGVASTTARSLSPSKSRSKLSATSTSRIRTDSRGCRSRSRAAMGASRTATATGNPVTRSGPAGAPSPARRSCSASSQRASIASACASRLSAAAVSRTPRPCGSSRSTPRSRASCRICCEAAEG
ncbi:hypothetical protein STENM36S_07934 [Streptomyces tendae]